MEWWRERAPCGRRHAAGTYLWGALARVDVLSVPASTELVFYGSEVISRDGAACQQPKHDCMHFQS